MIFELILGVAIILLIFAIIAFIGFVFRINAEINSLSEEFRHHDHSQYAPREHTHYQYQEKDYKNYMTYQDVVALLNERELEKYRDKNQ